MQGTHKLLVFATLAGLVVGFGLGRVTAPSLERATTPTPPVGAAPPRPEAGSLPGSEGAGADTPTLLDDADRLAGIREMAESAMSWGASPQRVVHGLIEQMDEDELLSMVANLTDYSREELEDVQDIRAFAERLAMIAMDGTVLPSEELGPEVQNVSFTGEVMEDNSPVAPRRHFESDQEKIYATFPSDDLEGARVMAKWTRADDGQIVLFRRYRIDPGDDWSFVWVGTPSGGWEPGEYRVDFYSADEEMRVLASGRHIIMP